MKTDDLTSFEVGSDDPVEVLYCFNPLDYGFTWIMFHVRNCFNYMVLADNFGQIHAAYNFRHRYILYGCLKLAASEITNQYHTCIQQQVAGKRSPRSYIHRIA